MIFCFLCVNAHSFPSLLSLFNPSFSLPSHLLSLPVLSLSFIPPSLSSNPSSLCSNPLSLYVPFHLLSLSFQCLLLTLFHPSIPPSLILSLFLPSHLLSLSSILPSLLYFPIPPQESVSHWFCSIMHGLLVSLFYVSALSFRNTPFVMKMLFPELFLLGTMYLNIVWYSVPQYI